jgi:pimeloyl-ACP methyl ester carboxylesterase
MRKSSVAVAGLALALAGIPINAAAQQAAPPAVPAFTDPVVVDKEFPAGMASLRIPSGGVMMNGVLLIAQGKGPHPTVLMFHGHPGYETNSDLAQEIRRQGWNVLLFHYRGAWGSEGSYTLAGLREDADAVLRFTREAGAARQHRIDPRTIVLVGHSAGGGIALAAAARDQDVAGVVAIAAGDPSILGDAAATPEGLAAAARQLGMQLGPLQGATGESLARELAQHREELRLERLAPGLTHKAVLFVSGSRDVTTPAVRNQGPLVAALRKAGAQQLSEVVLDADHSFSDKRIALAHTITSWLAQLRPQRR